jgi:hypothetical protein
MASLNRTIYAESSSGIVRRFQWILYLVSLLLGVAERPAPRELAGRACRTAAALRDHFHRAILVVRIHGRKRSGCRSGRLTLKAKSQKGNGYFTFRRKTSEVLTNGG